MTPLWSWLRRLGAPRFGPRTAPNHTSPFAWVDEQEFDRPTQALILTLETRLLQMPVTESAVPRHKDREPEILGGVETISTALQEVLENDCCGLLGDEAHRFAYVLAYEPARSTLNILTRLWTDGAEGSVYYGRYVQRRATDLYHLWIDD